MKNTVPNNLGADSAIGKDENTEQFSIKVKTEEIVLYDECGDTQWDKVLTQHDLAEQLSENIKNNHTTKIIHNDK